MWRKAFLFSALLSVIFVLPLAMEAATTSSVNLYGGYVEDVAIDEANGYGWVALNSPNGLYYTTDNSTWNGLPAGSDYGDCTAVETSDNYTYAICGINLYRTTDGSSWDTLGLSNVGQYMYHGENRFFVLMRDQSDDEYATLAISSDEGENFTTDVEVTGATSVLGISSSDDTVYVLGSLSSGYGLFKSTDGGSTWSDTSSTFSSGTYLSVSTSLTDADYVAVQSGETGYLSTDGGSSFSEIEGVNLPGQVLFVGDRLYCGTNYSDDLGTNWTEIDGGDVAVGRNYLDVSGSKILAGTSIGVAISTDSGSNWVETKEGIEALEVDGIAQHPSNKDKVILAIYGGFARTENYTDTTPTWEFNTEVGSTMSVFYGTSLVLVGVSGDIYYSTDDGETLTSAGVSEEHVSNFIRSDGVYYASHSEGVLSSSDGMTWTDFGLDGVPVNALAKTSTGKLYAAVGDENDSTSTNLGIYKYNGSSWSQLITEGVYNDIIVVDNVKGNNTVYAISQPESGDLGGKIISSTDYGNTWDDLTGNGFDNDGWYHSIVAQDSNEDVLYVSTARPAGTGKIFKTLDGGDSWSLFYTGLADETFEAMLYDDLMIGSNVGLKSVNSEAKIRVTRTKKSVKTGNRSRLKVTLTDKDTGDALSNKPIKLYYRYKKTGTWKLLKTKKTGPKGKTSFNRKLTKKTYFKVSWKPKKASVKRAYNSSAYKKLTNVGIR